MIIMMMKVIEIIIIQFYWPRTHHSIVFCDIRCLKLYRHRMCTRDGHHHWGAQKRAQFEPQRDDIIEKLDDHKKTPAESV